jgi:hypothetical protein
LTVVAVIHHLAQPFLGHAGRALDGVTVQERFVNEGDPLPDLDQVDAIVSLGAEEILRRPDGFAEGFRIGRAWGIQLHPEVDARALDGWYAACREVLAPAGVREVDARAADARRLRGQAALSRAIFGAYARQDSHAPGARVG